MVIFAVQLSILQFFRPSGYWLFVVQFFAVPLNGRLVSKHLVTPSLICKYVEVRHLLTYVHINRIETSPDLLVGRETT